MSIEIQPSSATVAARDVQRFGTSSSAAFSLSPDLGTITKIDDRTCAYKAPVVWRTRTVLLGAAGEEGRAAAVITVSPTPFWLTALALFWGVLFATLLLRALIIWPPPVDPPWVEVYPPVVTAPAGSSVQFLAGIWNADDRDVNWSVSDGTITPTGLFTAPQTGSTVTVTATRKADSKHSGAALVQLVAKDAAGLALSPAVAETVPPAPVRISAATAAQAAITSWTCTEMDGRTCGSGAGPLPVNFTPPAGALPRRLLITAFGAEPAKAGAVVYAVARTPAAADGLAGRFRRDKTIMELVLLMGALGAVLGASRSFVNFVGNRQFVPSWGFYYLARPALGSGVALLVFFAYRIGALTAPTGYSAADPAAAAFIAGIVGLFVDFVLGKLYEVISVLIPLRDPRTDPLTANTGAATATTTTAADTARSSTGSNITATVAAGRLAAKQLFIRGTGFTANTRASIGGRPRNTTLINATQLSVELIPGTDAVGPVTVTLTDGASSITVNGAIAA